MRRKISENKKRIVVDIPTALHGQFKFYAESRGSSMSWLVQKYITELLAQKAKSK